MCVSLSMCVRFVGVGGEGSFCSHHWPHANILLYQVVLHLLDGALVPVEDASTQSSVSSCLVEDFVKVFGAPRACRVAYTHETSWKKLHTIVSIQWYIKW